MTLNLKKFYLIVSVGNSKQSIMTHNRKLKIWIIMKFSKKVGHNCGHDLYSFKLKIKLVLDGQNGGQNNNCITFIWILSYYIKQTFI